MLEELFYRRPTGISAWFLGAPRKWWFVGAVLIFAVIPFTLIVMMPTNKKLLDPGRIVALPRHKLSPAARAPGPPSTPAQDGTVMPGVGLDAVPRFLGRPRAKRYPAGGDAGDLRHQPEQPLGTVAYCLPEQALGEELDAPFLLSQQKSSQITVFTHVFRS